MPSAAVRDEGALQMRPAPCGYSSACVLRPHFLFSFRKGNGVARQRKREPRKTGSASRAAIASEEASSIPFPAGRRKLHIRWLLLPFQTVTASLGHSLGIRGVLPIMGASLSLSSPGAAVLFFLQKRKKRMGARRGRPLVAPAESIEGIAENWWP